MRDIDAQHEDVQHEDVRHERAVQRADALIATCELLQQELRGYERHVRRVRNAMARGTVVPLELSDASHNGERLTDRIEHLEHMRRMWRVAMFRLQADAGMSLAAIARQWGLSRQLVSRLLRDDTGPSTDADVA